MDLHGVSLSWTGNPWRDSARASHGAFLYGNSILFWEKFPSAPGLVRGNEAIQKAFGELCKGTRHDRRDKAQNYFYGVPNDAVELLFHEKCTVG